jgi:hypothetical protein
MSFRRNLNEDVDSAAGSAPLLIPSLRRGGPHAAAMTQASPITALAGCEEVNPIN